ncbi:MAG TPA: glycosyltransferase N-terminal domain-containing protein [Cytophagaceae bacterium]
MLFFYNLAVTLYALAITLAAPFNSKARKWVAGRRRIFKRLKEAFSSNESPVAWFHCASLGEFEQARPVLENFRERFPGFKILLTFFSPSGYEIRKNYASADYVFYLPIDTKRNAKRFIEITNPEIVFFVKYEFWHHYLHQLHQKKITILCFSAIFRPDQIFFKSGGKFFLNILKKFDHLFIQNKASLDLLQKFDINNAEVCGDTRFDRVLQIWQQKKDIEEARLFKDNKKLLVIGSAWKEDMAVLLPFINSYNKELKVIIAPHEIRENEINEMVSTLKKRTIRFSQISSPNTELASYEVLIIDNIGMLSSLYAYADFAFIGGAFGKGLHNILEAATFGMPIFFGPNYGKFQEAIDLLGMGCAFTISNTDEFYNNFDVLYVNDSSRKFISLKAQEYIRLNTGATGTIMNYCQQLLK